ncbi:MAG: helix-turn-helix domain-containing protein [Prevotella sp.]|nr:helix-turn-helix domain-containing protein [Prevotella sp.]MCM1473869.1 helix-turn-helix domain-containing protein [Muribaculaceae bacterium]
MNNKLIFANNLTYYMKINNIDRYKLCDDLNFNYSTVSEWLNGKKYPRIDKIEMIANYFHIKKSNLIEIQDRDNNPISQTINNKNTTVTGTQSNIINSSSCFDEYEQELLKLFHCLPIAQKAEVIVMVNKLIENNKEKGFS